MRRQLFMLFIVMSLFSAVYGAAGENDPFFKEYIILGNKAYADSNWDEACKYYKQAYALKPTAEVQKLIQYCVEKQKKPEQAAVKKPRTTSATDGIAINIFNLSAAAMAYFFYTDYAAKSEEYASFETGPLPFPEERQMKLDLLDQMDGSRNTFVTMTCVAGASILYTFFDFLFIHAIFPDNINTTLVPDRHGLMLAVNTDF